MPSIINPTISMIGLLTQAGAIQNMCDGSDLTFWQPYADGLDSYLQPPVGDAGFVIADGSPRPCIQFDFGENVRIPMFRVKVDGPKSIGQCYLIASDNTATSLTDTVQASDINAGGYYTPEQMNSGNALITKAQTTPIRKRFWRFVFWKQPPAA